MPRPVATAPINCSPRAPLLEAAQQDALWQCEGTVVHLACTVGPRVPPPCRLRQAAVLRKEGITHTDTVYCTLSVSVAERCGVLRNRQARPHCIQYRGLYDAAQRRCIQRAHVQEQAYAIGHNGVQHTIVYAALSNTLVQSKWHFRLVIRAHHKPHVKPLNFSHKLSQRHCEQQEKYLAVS
jgi:hypothetical protein